MPAHRFVPVPRRWWHRLVRADAGRAYGLPDAWHVVAGPSPGTEVAVGPGGVFLLDHRRTPPADLARHAGALSGRLTATLGHLVTVHAVLVEEAERAVRADQPADVVVVTAVVLGPWLASHPRAFDDRAVRALLHAVQPDHEGAS